VQAARAVNTELIVLYWQIGRLIVALPGEVRAALPSPEEFEDVVERWRRRNSTTASTSGAASATLTYRNEYGQAETAVVS